MPDQLIDWEKWERIADTGYRQLSTSIAMNTCSTDMLIKSYQLLFHIPGHHFDLIFTYYNVFQEFMQPFISLQCHVEMSKMSKTSLIHQWKKQAWWNIFFFFLLLFENLKKYLLYTNYKKSEKVEVPLGTICCKVELLSLSGSTLRKA